MLFGTPILSLATGWWLLRRAPTGNPTAVTQENDVAEMISRTAGSRWLASLAGVLLFVFTHLELNRTLGHFYAPVRLPLLTVLWAVLCISVVELVGRRRPQVGSALAFVVALVILLKLFLIDVPSWDFFPPDFLYRGEYHLQEGLMRLLDFGAAVFCFIWAARAFLHQKEAEGVSSVGQLFVALALALPFVAVTLEVRTLMRAFFPGLEAGGVSIWWGLYALGLLLSGIRRKVRVLRYCGLALFTIVAFKIFFVDLAELQQVYRIIAFIVLGLVVLSGSFVYLKYREVFETEKQV